MPKERKLKVFRAIVVTTITLECASSDEAYAVVEHAARCNGAVGPHFTVKDHAPEIKIVAEINREE